MTRNPNMREAILSAAELLFSTNGFNAVSIRDIALEAGANPGSITYHFKSKDGLLLEIYKRHCGPMNKRRIELLVAARRVRDVQDRLEAIVTSMTIAERRKPSIIDGSRRKRIAAGSGTNVQAVNQLIKQFGQMQKMMRRIQQGKMPSPDQLIRGMR